MSAASPIVTISQIQVHTNDSSSHGLFDSSNLPKAAACKNSPVEIRIRAGSKSRYWKDLWDYRELLITLAGRDLSVRYKQTFFGVAWAILQPLTAVLLMTFIFGKLAGLKPPEGASYIGLVVAGMLPWQLFSNILSSCAPSLVSNANLISKIYFPRVIVPLASLVVALVDFAVMIFLFIPILLWQGGAFLSWKWLTLPIFFVCACVAALGPALLMSALNVKYRDFRFLVPFFLQMGLYFSPVAYSASLVREKLGPLAAHLYALNPLVGIIDGCRWALYGGQVPLLSELAISCVVSAVFLGIGLSYFHKVEKQFADVI